MMSGESRDLGRQGFRPLSLSVVALVLALLVLMTLPVVALADDVPYRVGHMFGPLESLNPATAYYVGDSLVLGRIYEPLVDVQPAGDVPVLARRWSSKPTGDGGQVITFRLRGGVRWHDGEKFEADDAAFSLLLARDSGPDSTLWNAGVDSITSVEALKKLTLKVYSSDPSFLALRDIASTTMLPKHIWEGVADVFTFENDTPVGTGPFSYNGAVALTHQLSRFNRYWAGRAKLNEIHITAIDSNEPDPAPTPAQRIGSDQFDMWLPQATDNVEVEEANTTPGVGVHMQPKLGFRYLAFNFRRPTTGDLVFREAIGHLVNREASLAAAGAGSQATPLDQVVPDLYGRWQNPNAGAPGFDPAAARQLLEDAGYFDQTGDWTGGPIELLAPDFPYAPIRAQFALDIAAEAHAIGVPLTVNLTDFATIVDRVFDPIPDFDMYILGWGLGDSLDYLFQFFHSDSFIFNTPGIDDPDLDAAIDAMRTASKEVDAIAGSISAQTILAEQLPYLVLLQELAPTFYDTSFKGYKVVNGEDWLLNNKTLLNLKLNRH